ncbi:hypothetical protein BX070DRAFT_220940 [Coemansia spiralis]|nr:hypothetical protein BX070DRAFT_220940 [Coemansia spiralis]
MQFFLDDDDTITPIRLFSPSNAPRRQQYAASIPAQQAQSAARRPQRSVPGYPYIRFVDDDDYDGSFSFDAFQDLRSAYVGSPLMEIQSQLRTLQQQRAQAQLHRALLAQQLREHERRERELQEYQYQLERQRQLHAKRAAEHARQAYLARLKEEERQKQIESQRAAEKAAQEARARRTATARKAMADQQSQIEEDASDGEDLIFYPPFHFFNHILNRQLRSQDEAECKRAQKSALNNLLDMYFGGGKEDAVSNNGNNSTKQPVATTPSADSATPTVAANAPSAASSAVPAPSSSPPQLPAPTQTSLPFALRGLHADQNALDNVLRVVRNRLDEIGAEESAEENRQKIIRPDTEQKSGKDKKPSDANKVSVNVTEEPTDEASEPDFTLKQPQKQQHLGPEKPDAGQKEGVEVEEPTDYSKAAQTLRSRVDNLDNDSIGHDNDDPWSHVSTDYKNKDVVDASEPSLSQDKPKDGSNTAMDVDDTDGQHSDSEFARLLHDCKCQLNDMQEAATKPESESIKRRRRRHHNQRNKRPQHDTGRKHQLDHPHETTRQDTHKPSDSKDEAMRDSTSAAAAIESAAQEAVREPETHEEQVSEQTPKEKQQILEALRQLREISKDLDKVRKDYNWRLRDTQLAFVADKHGNLKLAYNRKNSAFHEYQETLQKLLFKLDAIPSYGDFTVRDRRKSIVKKIQNTLDALDQFAADQGSELSEASPNDTASSWADESSNGDWN